MPRNHGVAASFRDGLKMLIDEMGETFEIVRNEEVIGRVRGSRDAKASEVRFLPGVSLQEGDVLRSIASNKSHFVRTVEEDITDDELVRIRVSYETEAEKNQRLNPSPSTPTYHIGAIHNSIVGSQQQALLINAATSDTNLTSLLEELRMLLAQTPESHAREAARLVRRAEAAVVEATDPDGDKEVAKVSLEGLQKAAKNLAGILPSILPLAERIAQAVENHF